MKRLVPAGFLLFALAACDSPYEPPPGPDSGFALAGVGGNPLDYDLNGNGLVCSMTVPPGDHAPDHVSRRTVYRDDTDGICPGGFEAKVAPRGGSIATNGMHTCALDAGGQAWCWGSNTFGVLGSGMTTSLVPVMIPGATRLVALTAGGSSVCGLDEDGAAWCWGANDSGQLGNGDLSVVASPAPLPVTGGHRFVAIDAGLRSVCGLEADGDAFCWGRNDDGQLGTSGSLESCGSPCSSTPVASAAPLRFAAISVGLQHTCGSTASGEAYCWGWDAYAQDGDGIHNNTGPGPRRVATGTALAGLSAGAIHTCALGPSSEAYCWGWKGFGPVGDGALTGFAAAPVAVAGGHAFDQVTTSQGNNIHAFSCGIDAAGSAWCWGANPIGQLGTASTDLDTCLLTGAGSVPFPCVGIPVPVAGGLAWSELALGSQVACGRTTSGALYCWGRGTAGALGTGDMNDRSIPTPVAGFGGVALAVAGEATRSFRSSNASIITR